MTLDTYTLTPRQRLVELILESFPSEKEGEFADIFDAALHLEEKNENQIRFATHVKPAHATWDEACRAAIEKSVAQGCAEEFVRGLAAARKHEPAWAGFLTLLGLGGNGSPRWFNWKDTITWAAVASFLGLLICALMWIVSVSRLKAEVKRLGDLYVPPHVIEDGTGSKATPEFRYANELAGQDAMLLVKIGPFAGTKPPPDWTIDITTPFPSKLDGCAFRMSPGDPKSKEKAPGVDVERLDKTLRLRTPDGGPDTFLHVYVIFRGPEDSAVVALKKYTHAALLEVKVSR